MRVVLFFRRSIACKVSEGKEIKTEISIALCIEDMEDIERNDGGPMCCLT